jgi:hypothetical protein
MKKILSIGFLFLFAIALTGCDKDKTTETTNKTRNKISNTQLSREDGENKLIELMEQMQNGEITPDEFKKKNKEITNNTETAEEMMKRTNSNISDFTGIPSWASTAGAIATNGLTLIQAESSITTKKDDYPNSFTATYEGDIDTMKSEAKRLATELKLNIDHEDTKTFLATGKLAETYDVIISLYLYKNGIIRMGYTVSETIK